MLLRSLLLSLCFAVGLQAGPLEEATALLDREKYREALPLFEEARAANLSPDVAELGCIACLSRLRRVPEAIQRSRTLAQKFPRSWLVAMTLAQLLFVEAKDAEAIAVLERALKIAPQHPELRNSLAWVLATTPSKEFRNGPRAVQLSTGLSSKSPSDLASYRDTLAAAYAAAGRFPEAVKMQEAAMPDLLKDRDSTYRSRSRARERLASYRQGQAWYQRPTMNQ